MPKLGYLRMVEIAELGDAGVSAARIGVLGHEPLIGRNLARRFCIILDHVRQVILEPSVTAPMLPLRLQFHLDLLRLVSKTTVK